jgi:Alcohol dehydrogenase GroES-like domain
MAVSSNAFHLTSTSFSLRFSEEDCAINPKPPKWSFYLTLLRDKSTMKAIVYDAPRQFSYRDVETPKIQPDEILLRVDACGLCGTDVHVHEGDFGPRFPLTPGHEFSGEIVELGSEVKGLKMGQRATASTTIRWQGGCH